MTNNPSRSHEYFHEPIVVDAFYRDNYKKFKSVKILETENETLEPLVDVRDFGIPGSNHYHNQWNPPYYHRVPGSIEALLVRSSVAERLQDINTWLEQFDLELFVFDGYRPQTVQSYFYYEWFPGFLRQMYPEKDSEWIQSETDRYWSRGARSKKDLDIYLPPHSTGGAVDLTLRSRRNKQTLEMGSMFDDCATVSNLEYIESVAPGSASLTLHEALANRRFLHHAFRRAGFAYHPYEWWHFSFGDPMWAICNRSPNALYGYCGGLVNEVLPGDQ